MVRAVPARVQIRVTRRALVAEADSLSARERMVPIARSTTHSTTLWQPDRGVKPDTLGTAIAR